MSGWHPAGKFEAFTEGVPVPMKVGEVRIALYRLGEEVFAIGDMCPHQPDVKLSDGFVDGDVIECPMHQSCFAIRTGKLLGPPAREDVASYPTKIDGDGVFVEV
jgi:nitrite reductase/ring-hydroxylating ferredoxin subunit